LTAQGKSTAPDEYAEEAAFYFRIIDETLGHTPGSVLELGSGGGNNAVHYKEWVDRVALPPVFEKLRAEPYGDRAVAFIQKARKMLRSGGVPG